MTAASRKQVGMLHGLLGKLGIADRAEKLQVLSAIVWRRVESSAHLTVDEASVAINTLQEVERAGGDSRARLAEIVASTGVLS